jgi:hypothetical protein
MQHHRAVLADRVKHDRLFALGHHLAHDVDALGFQALQVGEPHGRKRAHIGGVRAGWMRVGAQGRG